MKKQFLCTSAIALGVVAAPATAQDWNLDWGGYMTQQVGIGDISTNTAAHGGGGEDWDGDGLDIVSDSEIHFTPSVTLDNGMTFGVNIQFEGEQAISVDETYASISSDTFGRLDIGSENSAGYKSMVGAPEVGTMGINSPSTSAFIPYTGVDDIVTSNTALPFRQAGTSSFTEVGGNNDVQRISYYTPDFNGLTIGVSYAPEADGNATNSDSLDTNAVISDIFDIGVNYSQSFGSTDITLAARWGTGNTPSDEQGASDFETWGIGAQIGFGNVTVGGSWAENDNDETTVTGAGVGDSEGWTFGASFDTAGPWSFGATTFQSETDTVAAGVVDGKVDREAYKISASRDLGPGVGWDIYLVQESRDDDRFAGTEVEGTILGTAINLSF